MAQYDFCDPVNRDVRFFVGGAERLPELSIMGAGIETSQLLKRGQRPQVRRNR